jgi:hypothetical protein
MLLENPLRLIVRIELLTIGIQISESTLLARWRGQHPEQQAPYYWILYHDLSALTSEAKYRVGWVGDFSDAGEGIDLPH